MKPWPAFFPGLIVLLFLSGCSNGQKNPSVDNHLFNKNNLLVWCVVPYDSENRSPAERAIMLTEMGFTKFAYDWRDHHLPDFPEEINVLKEHKIKLSAAWLWIDERASDGLLPEHDKIFDALENSGTSTRIWVGMHDNFYDGLSIEQKLEKVSGIIIEVHQRAQLSGSSIALYNHGGWASEPDNQVRIIKETGHDDIGIVFNFHHGHKHIDRFDEVLDTIMPWLVTVNLNGMEKDGAHILDIGKGEYEKEMIRTLLKSGFTGDIGIIGHTEDEDVNEVLQRNLDGLQKILADLGETDALSTY
ncbi:TIM barrel protein [soil metagenome]